MRNERGELRVQFEELEVRRVRRVQRVLIVFGI